MRIWQKTDNQMTEVCETSLSGKRYRDWCIIMAVLLRFHWHLLCSLMVLPGPPCDLDLGHNGKSQSYTFCSALIQPRADFTTLRPGWRLEKKSYHRFATAREYIDRGRTG